MQNYINGGLFLRTELTKMVILIKRRVGTIIALFKIISNLFKMKGGINERI
jgi:hypothetical protein